MLDTAKNFNPETPLLPQDLRPVPLAALKAYGVTLPQEDGVRFTPYAVARTVKGELLLLCEEATEDQGLFSWFFNGERSLWAWGGSSFRRALFNFSQRGLEDSVLLLCPTLPALEGETFNHTGELGRFAAECYRLSSCKACGEDQETSPERFGGMEPVWLDSERLLGGLTGEFNFIGVDDGQAPCLCLACASDGDTFRHHASEACWDILGGGDLEAIESLQAAAVEGKANVIFDICTATGGRWVDARFGGERFLLFTYGDISDRDHLQELILDKVPSGFFREFELEEVLEANDLSYEEYLEDEWGEATEGFISCNGGQYHVAGEFSAAYL